MSSPAPMKGYKTKKADSAAEVEATVDEKKDESDDGEDFSLSFTFTTKPSGTSLKLHERKAIEALITGVIEKKLKKASKSFTLTVKVAFADDGTVSSVKVSGDADLAKAIEKKLDDLEGYGKLDSLEITVAVNI